MTESEIQARIATLQAARDTGVLIVKHGDTSTTFRSLAEIDSVLTALRAQLASAQGTPRSNIRYPVQSDKGY